MIKEPEFKMTLRDYIEKAGLRPIDLVCGDITSAQVYSWLRTATPWRVSEIGGKLVAHPPNRLIVLGGATSKSKVKKKAKKPARKGRAKRV